MTIAIVTTIPSHAIGLLHPQRNIALAMEHTPNIDMI